jgi:glycerol-3-phosphate dehydrogenase
MIPWNGRTLVGTTDTSYNGDLDAVRCEAEDESYLLSHANAALRPNAQWTTDDIISRFAGLRTFPAADGDSSSLSREWEAVDADPGVIASVGGKYTSARADAAQLVRKVAKQLNHETLACPTTWRPLPWRPEGRYRSWQQRSLTRALHCGLDEETAAGCQLRYGEQVEALCDLVERLPELAQRYVQDAPYCVGELVFISQHEAVCHLEDVLRRRLPLLLVSRLSRERVAFAAAVVGKVLGWNKTRREEELSQLCTDWKIES